MSTSFTTAPRFSPSEASPSSTMKAVEDHVLPRRKKKKEQRENFMGCCLLPASPRGPQCGTRTMFLLSLTLFPANSPSNITLIFNTLVLSYRNCGQHSSSGFPNSLGTQAPKFYLWAEAILCPGLGCCGRHQEQEDLLRAPDPNGWPSSSEVPGV